MKKIYLLFFSIGLLANANIHAQATTEYLYTTAGSTYVQNFDSLPASAGSVTMGTGVGHYNLTDAPLNVS